MTVFIDKSFDKDTANIQDKAILKKIAESVINAMKAKKLSEIQGLKKLSGFENEYRIRINDYRIGLVIENDNIKFIRCLHRKEIYRYFP